MNAADNKRNMPQAKAAQKCIGCGGPIIKARAKRCPTCADKERSRIRGQTPSHKRAQARRREQKRQSMSQQ